MGTDTAVLDMLTELYLLSFSCADDDGGDVYSGILAEDEDGRNIPIDHPIEQSEGCRYETWELMLGSLTYQVRNCGENGCVCVDRTGDDFIICNNDNNDDGEVIDTEQIAGANCMGGTSGLEEDTQEACEESGGSYEPYTCGEAQLWLQGDENHMD